MTLPLISALTPRNAEPPKINDGPGGGPGSGPAETGHRVAKRGAIAMLALGACMVAGRILLQRKAR
jgi:hypothetical protein